MGESIRPRRAGLYVRVGIATVLAAVGLFVAVESGRRRTAAAVIRVSAIMDEWRSALDARPLERPVLAGVAVEGDAFEAYDRALVLSRSVPDLDARVDQALSHHGDASDVEGLLADTGAALEALREGAHRTRGGRRWSERAAAFPRDVSVLELHTLGKLLQLRVRHFVAQEDHVRATRAALDGLQWASDLAQGPLLVLESVGGATRATILTDLQRAAPWAGWEDEPLRVLLEGLRLVEVRLRAPSHVVRADAVSMLSSNGESGPSFPGSEAILRLYRESGGLDVVEALDLAEQELAASEEPLETLEVIHRRTLRDGDPLELSAVRGFISVTRRRIVALTRLRVLLEALAFRLGEAVDELDDPTGKGFVRERKDGYLKLSTPGLPEVALEVDLHGR